MLFTLNNIIDFYTDCNYWPSKQTLRPRSLNIPQTISKLDEEYIKKACAQGNANSKVVINLDSKDCKNIAPILLHESLFHFYKSFYNYLAARCLFFGGLSHWINISVYYSKFYLAKSLTVLAGKQSYWVTPQNILEEKNPFYICEIAKALKPNKPYRARIEIDIDLKKGKIFFDKNRVNSHKDVWNDYKVLPLADLKISKLLPELYGRSDSFPVDFIIGHRNQENYSFDGYEQLDFNIAPNSFKQYFERDRVKRDANRLYDMESGQVLVAFSTQFNLYHMLNVKKLPIENKKFLFMINYCLPDSSAKEKLIQLCKEGFPTKELYSDDGAICYDEKGSYI